MKLKHLLTAAWALALVGCYNDTEEMRPEPTPMPLRVEAYVNDLQTRAGYDTESLMEFGLYVDLNGETENNDRWNNIRVFRSAADQPWSLDPQPYWPSEESTGTFYAYAPRVSQMDDPANFSFSVQADQTTEANVKASDLLWTEGTGTEANEPLTINLNHKLCKLQLTLDVAEGLPDNLEYTGVQLEGTLPTVAVNLTDGTLGAVSGTEQIIQLFKNANDAWECIFIPQTATISVRIFAKEGEEEKEYLYTTESPVAFAAGTRYGLALTVTSREVSGADFEAGDWTVTEGEDLGSYDPWIE